jgi:hypothetical protein
MGERRRGKRREKKNEMEGGREREGGRGGAEMHHSPLLLPLSPSH